MYAPGAGKCARHLVIEKVSLRGGTVGRGIPMHERNIGQLRVGTEAGPILPPPPMVQSRSQPSPRPDEPKPHSAPVSPPAPEAPSMTFAQPPP